MWLNMRVCAVFPGREPGTKRLSFWEPGMPCKCHDWAEAVLGTNPDNQLAFGRLGPLALSI